MSESTAPQEFNGFKFGMIKDRVDERDYVMFRTTPKLDVIPKYKNLERILPDPDMMDQKATGSCGGYSAVQTLRAAMIASGHPAPFVGSPPFAYRMARYLGGYVEQDSGCELRLVWKALADFGLPRFEEWPPNFDRSHLADRNGIFPPGSDWRRQPPQSVFDSALKSQTVQYFRLGSAAEIMRSIADGFPVQFGYAVFNNTFDKNGNPVFTIGMPGHNDYIVGYHAVTAYGYDLRLRTPRIYFRNNWGKIAHEGRPNFSLSVPYVDKHKLDIWTPRLVEITP